MSPKFEAIPAAQLHPYTDLFMLALSKKSENEHAFTEMRRISERLSSCLTSLKHESVQLKEQNKQIIQEMQQKLEKSALDRMQKQNINLMSKLRTKQPTDARDLKHQWSKVQLGPVFVGGSVKKEQPKREQTTLQNAANSILRT